MKLLRGAKKRFRKVAWMLCVLGSLAGSPATAQVGVPVTDPANLALEVMHNIQQGALTDDVVFKVLQIYTTLRRLDDHRWQDIDGALEAMRRSAAADGGLGYGEEGLAAVFEEVFPGTAGYAGPWYLEKQDVVDRLRSTAQNYGANLHRQSDLWRAAYRDALRHRRDLEDILGQQEAYDILLSLGVFEVNEWRLMRQLMIQDLTLQAAQESETVNEHAQKSRTVWLSLTGDAPPRPE